MLIVDPHEIEHSSKLLGIPFLFGCLRASFETIFFHFLRVFPTSPRVLDETVTGSPVRENELHGSETVTKPIYFQEASNSKVKCLCSEPLFEVKSVSLENQKALFSLLQQWMNKAE